MSIPNPVGIPGGSVTRNGSPACGGSGRRRGRIGMTFGASTSQSRSGGSPPIARKTASGVACSMPLPRSHVRYCLPALRRRLARRFSVSFMRAG